MVVCKENENSYEDIIMNTTPQASQDQFELTIVMPCLNEAKTLGMCVDQAVKAIADSGLRGEVIVADNGSTDGSREIAVEHGARMVPVPVRGYGAALAGGIAAARSKYVVMGDCDMSYDFGHAPRIVEKLREGYDLVMGNRFMGGIAPGAMPFLHKYLGNPVLSTIGRVFFRSPVRDFHCGLRGFNREKILALNLRTTGMEFASEMVVKATLHKLKLAEVPTTLSPDLRDRAPHLRTWRDGWRHLRFLLLFSPRWLFLIPGSTAMVLGLMLFLMGLTDAAMGKVHFNVNTMLFGALSIVLGGQAVFFALLAKTFAVTTGMFPPSERVEKFYKRFNLERGVQIGGALFGLGMLALITSIYQWATAEFGELSTNVTRYWVIPGFTLVAMGVQTILSSFLISALGMERK